MPSHASSGIEGRSDVAPAGATASPGSRPRSAAAARASREFPAARQQRECTTVLTLAQIGGIFINMGTAGRITIAMIASYAAGFIGSLFVNTDVSSWYAHLAKPPLTPDNWVFLPVWIILYGLIGLGFGVMWSKNPLWDSWNGLFFVAVAFNVAWTMFFFGYHAILIALIDIVCLAVLLIVLILSAWETDHRASLLLLPYMAWVIFGAYLNAGIWLLN